MQITHDNKGYDTERMELIAERSAHCNGNYSGENQLWIAKDGTLFEATTSNGQDLYRNDAIWSAEKDAINKYELTTAQEQRAQELGLIEIV